MEITKGQVWRHKKGGAVFIVETDDGLKMVWDEAINYTDEKVLIGSIEGITSKPESWILEYNSV